MQFRKGTRIGIALVLFILPTTARLNTIDAASNNVRGLGTNKLCSRPLSSSQNPSKHFLGFPDGVCRPPLVAPTPKFSGATMMVRMFLGKEHLLPSVP